MYRPFSIFYLLCLCWLGLASCYDEENTFGSGLVESAFRNVRIDTSTVIVTSVLIDSLETSGKQTALVGRYMHPLWGEVSACSYLPYTYAAYGTDADQTVRLDSLVLQLSYNAHFLGDTTLMQRFSVHRLQQKVVLNENGYLYTHSAVAYDPEPLAVYSFFPKPGSGGKLEIRLPDDLGQELLSRFHSRDLSVSSERFDDYFKGLVLVPDEAVSRSLLSFRVADTLCNVVLRYHIVSEQPNEQELVFSPNTSTQFNGIEHDRSGTLMEPYRGKQLEIPSASLGNRGFLFAGLGWYSRLEFPYLNNLMLQGELTQIETAELKIYPDPDTYSDWNALPDSIFLYIADENNVVTDAVTDYLGEQVQGGVLVKDEVFRENTYYFFDLSQFMKEELGASGIYKHNLQLMFNSNDYTTTFKNLTFSAPNGRAPIVLQLTYKIYESY